MEQRFANAWKMTVNEKKFIETALLSDLRVDGRRPFDYRRLTVKFGKVDGSSEVQLGQTHVMGFVTSQLVQPYRDRPNEGSLSIYTEFSPMADPSFEAGRPGEFAVELGRIIDRGLRESRAVDTESLCVLAGKLVWSIRIDLHILDNGGNLVDAANVAALAALMTFRRPECTFEGEDGQEVVVHPPEEKEPLPLIIHHLPIAITFAYIGDGNFVVIDPTHNEEAVMGGRMTATLNTNGDICSIQKVGEGIMQSVIMQCLRIASLKAADITTKIKDAVEAHNTERALRKIKRHSSVAAVDIHGPDIIMKERKDQPFVQKGAPDLPKHHMERIMDKLEDSCSLNSNCSGGETEASQQEGMQKGGGNVNPFAGTPLSWDPYSKGVDTNSLQTSSPFSGTLSSVIDKESSVGAQIPREVKLEETATAHISSGSLPTEAVRSLGTGQQVNGAKTLQDAVKPKNRRRKKASTGNDRS